jgi:glycosyltransferase involved in cell wall biosynthesis
MKNNPNISIVVPVYNSEKTLVELFARIDKVFYDLNKTYQLILVDDGSKDNSWNEIEKLKNNHSEKILAVRFGKNYGQHNAILCGFNYCTGDCIITLDDDLQNPPEEITKLYSKYQETNADVIYAIPIDKKNSVIRNAGSNFVKKTSEFSSKTNIGGSSYRFLKREIVLEIKNKEGVLFRYKQARGKTHPVIMAKIPGLPYEEIMTVHSPDHDTGDYDDWLEDIHQARHVTRKLKLKPRYRKTRKQKV